MSSADPAGPTLRHAARVILLDGGDRILLLKWRLQDGGHIWITPGGGLDAGESHPEAARRELWEELGLDVEELGPCVWLRDHVFTWQGRWLRQRERFYLVRVTAHKVDRTHNSRDELEVMEEARWWSMAEISASAERFSPSRLPLYLAALVAGPIPNHPVDVGA
ncbi:MAG: NUDIX domain-containing protein [Candidatus Dormibacteraeota bacterium]|nr:NUDIX domain-containing protein [Candidatus Dormibacteraeota bacterium]